MNDDFEVEPIWEKKPKKGIKTGQKGKRVERELCKELNKRFSKLIAKNSWGHFSRSVGSGNRWGQGVHLPKHAKDTFYGDITCPENFLFVIESKGGYNDIDLNFAFDSGHKEIDDFLKQVLDDSKRSGRKPLLIWKKDRKPRLAFIQMEFQSSTLLQFKYFMRYNDWVAVLFDDLIKLDDDFFFSL